MNYFNQLNAINVNEKTEKKNGLTYLSWAWAWGEVKKIHPEAIYTIYENAQGWCYHTDGQTAWVKTGVTICDIEHIEYLPVMDYRNKSIPVSNITSFDVNKAIQRSLTKAVARHGLGLYIYAGEDLPEEINDEKKQPNPPPTDEYFDKILESDFLSLEQVNEIYKTAKENADLVKEVLGALGYESSKNTPAKEFKNIIKEIKARL